LGNTKLGKSRKGCKTSVDGCRSFHLKVDSPTAFLRESSSLSVSRNLTSYKMLTTRVVEKKYILFLIHLRNNPYSNLEMIVKIVRLCDCKIANTLGSETIKQSNNQTIKQFLFNHSIFINHYFLCNGLSIFNLNS